MCSPGCLTDGLFSLLLLALSSSLLEFHLLLLFQFPFFLILLHSFFLFHRGSSGQFLGLNRLFAIFLRLFTCLL